MFSSLNNFLTPTRLSSRLTFYYSLTFVALLVLTLASLYASLGSLLDVRIDEDLLEDIEEFQSFYVEDGINLVTAEIRRETTKENDYENEFIRLYSQDGKLLYSSPGESWSEINLNQAAFSSKKLLEEPIFETQELEDFEFAVRIIYGQIADDLIIQIGGTIETKQEILSLVIKAFLLALIFIIPLASFIAWWIASKSARSIEQISQSVAEIEQGNYDARVDIKTNVKEINQLATTFNSMADRIKSLINEMREMIDNIAHDLRSPLGRIRAISENTLTNAQKPSAYINAAEGTLGECDRLLRMINSTLDVAEVEAGVLADPNTDVNLSEVVTEACELFEPVAHAKNQSLNFEIKDGCIVHGNLQNLQRMVANLIDNAINFTPEKGHIDVKLIKEKQECRIIISDTGIGISAPNQLRVFERFYRCDISRSADGCGLGLSFSKAVAKQHGGDIKIESKPNEFTAFTILLPA